MPSIDPHRLAEELLGAAFEARIAAGALSYAALLVTRGEAREVVIARGEAQAGVRHERPLARTSYVLVCGCAPGATPETEALEEAARALWLPCWGRIEEASTRDEPAFVVDAAQWRYVALNEAALRAWQRPAHELLGEVIWERFEGLAESEFGQMYQRAARDGEPGEVEGFLPYLGRWYRAQIEVGQTQHLIRFRDTTAEQTASQAKALHVELAELSGRADSAATLLAEATRHILARTGWCCAEAWFAQPDGSLVCAGLLCGGARRAAVSEEALEASRAIRQAACEAALREGTPRVMGARELALPCEAPDAEALVMPLVSASGALGVMSFWRDGAMRTDPWYAPVQTLHEGIVMMLTIRAEQLELGTIFALTRDMICVVGADRRFKRVNDTFCRELGWSREQLVGARYMEYVHPEDQEEVAAQAEALTRQGALRSFESRFRDAQGGWRWLSWSASRISTQGLICAVARDVTAEREARQQLTRNEQRFKLLTAATTDIPWDLDVERGVVWSQDVLSERGQASPEGEIPLERWAGHIHAEERAHVLGSLREAMRGRDESWAAEYRAADSAGAIRWLSSRAFILRDAGGQAQRVLGGINDISAKRREELHELRAQRLESLGALSGGIAHDLNNILTPILLSAAVLEEMLCDPEELELVEHIKGAARRGGLLLRQLLDFTRGSEGERKALDSGALVRVMVQLLRESLPNTIQITSALEEPLPAIRGDQTQLQQVLLNLAINARDAMPQGGRLIIQARRARMTPEGAPHLLLSVTDTGAGIPEALQEKIFDPFFTTKPLGEGTGLGLSTSVKIVRRHGGVMRVRSAPQCGSTFEVWLPCAEEEPAPQALPTRAKARGDGQLILVVEDEQTQRAALQQLLEQANYQVIAAPHGAEAVALYAQRSAQIALVLTDIAMPVMDGVALSHALRSISPTLPIVAVSGSLDQGLVDALHALPVQHILPKPYDVDELLEVLGRQLVGA